MKVQEEILATIKAFDRIIIHRHQRPDPDALGSQVGLAEILRASFPEKEIYQVGGPVEGLDYLALMQTIPDDFYKGALVIVTDTANAPRVSDQRYDQPYGELVWVNTKASSCSEMIVSFWQMFQNELTMTQEAARLLYAGIVGDTGRFLYPATTATTLRLAAELLDYGFDAPKINRQLDQVSRSVARLSGYVYENIEIDEIGAGKVILSQELQQRFGVVDSETSAVVSLPGKIDEVMAWAIFVEQPEGYYRVRMRSKGPVINEIAKRHHGGGHPLASGANAKDLEEVAVIYQEIQAAIKEFQAE